MTTTTSDVEPAPLAPEALAAYLRDRLEERMLGDLVAYGQLTVTVAPAALPLAAQLCRDDPRLAFDFFDFMSGVDEREDGIAVITHLYSIRHRHHIQLRAVAEGGREAPRLPTISHLYRGANWHEREAYDMFGVEFEGHPGLLPRILTVENFEGFPLRKEFLLMTREVKPWPGLKEPKEDTDEDGEGRDGAAPAGPGAGARGERSEPAGGDANEKARMAREKAERAKAKAAEARRLRAQERAAGQPETAGAAAAADTETPSGDGEVGAEKDAALEAGAGDDEIAHDPIEAAAVSDEPIAKDAAAGAVGGDTAAGASGDMPGSDQPIEDDAREAELAGGGPARPSGTPGVEAEGRHAGAEEQSGDRPASETEGMTSDTQEHEAARDVDETPAGDRGGAASREADGGRGLPPRGPGDEEPRALADEGVPSTPIAEEAGATVGDTYVERPGERRPLGTDADDRLREREAEAADASGSESDDEAESS